MSRGGFLRYPTAALSRLTGRAARIPVPRPLRRPVLGGAARLLGMDLSEAERPVRDFRSFDDLFVRRLKDGARAWPVSPEVPGSPVDGVAGQRGTIEDGRLLQAKGLWYTAAELLGGDDLAADFEGGSYLTIYLAPRHYHRVHAPVGGRIRRARHEPGRLLPVNGPAVRAVDRLFPRNERLVCLIDPPEGGGAGGRVAVVAVGAFNVGRITASFDTQLVTNRARARAETRVYHPPVEVRRGDEIMAFHLGSTVVLLFQTPQPLDATPEPGGDIRLGHPLGSAPGPAAGSAAGPVPRDD